MDRDTPPGQLRFALEGTPPQGCVVDPVTGQLVWTPSAVQGPGTYLITALVSDEEKPPRTDEQSFHVNVIKKDSGMPPPSNNNPILTISDLTRRQPSIDLRHLFGSDSNLSKILLTLTAAPNEICVIERSRDMVQWTPVGTHFIDHTGQCSVLIDAVKSGSFFRVRLVTDEFRGVQ